MMQSFFSRLLWAFILLVFQGLVFNHIHFFGYATPVIYVYILCLQPLNTSRYAWLDLQSGSEPISFPKRRVWGLRP